MSLETDLTGEQEPEERLQMHEELSERDEQDNEKPADADAKSVEQSLRTLGPKPAGEPTAIRSETALSTTFGCRAGNRRFPKWAIRRSPKGAETTEDFDVEEALDRL